MDVEHGVLTAVAILSLALVVGVAAERLRIPYIVALLVVSLPLAPFGSEEDFVHSFLVLLLPALVFEAAWNFHTRGLRTAWPAVLFLAAPGVVITVLLVAGGLALSGELPFVPGLLLGAIVAPTDPIAVIAAFKALNVPQRLAVTVEGESLFNDGVGVVMYGALALAVANGTHVDPLQLTGNVIVVSLGGALAGAIVAAVAFAVARFAIELDLPVVATVISAYGAYLAAEHVHVSGIFAALVAGITYRLLEDRFGRRDVVTQVDSFWGIASFFANTAVFLFVGARIEVGRILHSPGMVLTTIGLVLVARAVVVYGALPFLGIKQRSWQHTVMISGIRGGVSIALVLALPIDTPYRDTIIDAVYGVVAATILVQGTALGPVLKRLTL